MRNVSVIIPAYNEEGYIEKTLKEMPSQCEYSDEIMLIVVDDGSSDNTALIAEQYTKHVVRHGTNKGLGVALESGISYALKNGADIIVNIDADGQFDSNEIEKIIEPIIHANADVVIGDRFSNSRPENMSKIKYFGNKLMNFLINRIISTKLTDVSCGFRAYSREAALHLNFFGRFTYTQESIINLYYKNFIIKNCPINVRYFKNRQSKISDSIIKYAWRTFKIIIHSILYYNPLKYFVVPGIASTLIGLFFIVFLFINRIKTGGYTPFKAFGFIGAGFIVMGIIILFFSIIADILDKIRINQEKTLYHLKRIDYQKKTRF
jgi:glycosyltransferase involved in cell wall biosynthesis